MVKTNPYDFRLFVKFYGKNLRKNLRKFYSVMKFYVNLRKFFFRLQTLHLFFFTLIFLSRIEYILYNVSPYDIEP